MALLIHEENSYQQEQIIKKKTNGLDYQVFDFEELDLIEVYKEVTSTNLFNQYLKIIINFNIFANKTSKLKKKEEKLIEQMIKTTDELIMFTKVPVNSENRLFLSLAKVLTYEPMQQEKPNNIQHFIAEQKIEMGRGALEKLSNNLNNEENLIFSELIKLANYTNNKPITVDIIDKVSYMKIESNIFELFNFYLANKFNQQKKRYLELKEQGYESVGLLTIMAGQFRIIYKVKLLTIKGLNYRQIAKKLNINEYRAKIVTQQVSNVKLERIEKRYLRIAKVEYLIKSGKANPEIEVDVLMLT